MSWFKEAFSIAIPDPGSHYSAISTLDFYEWRYNGVAPKGSKFSVGLPPSDIFTEDKVIVSALIDSECLDKSAKSFVLKKDSPVEVKLCAGGMPSPRELLDKYHAELKSFSKGQDMFKDDLITRIYINSKNDDPHLFRLHHFTDKDITLHNFGSVKDLIEKFMKIKEALVKDVMDKTGRAYEMEEFRRYENAITFINNSHLHVDASKMDRLLTTSGIKSEQTKTISWKECYLEASLEAQNKQSRIKEFESKKWVQDAISSRV